MVRTQIYLTEAEREALDRLASETGKNQSELIREAVDEMIARRSLEHRRQMLRRAAGMWKHREDLPDFQALRRQWDRS